MICDTCDWRVFYEQSRVTAMADAKYFAYLHNILESNINQLPIATRYSINQRPSHLRWRKDDTKGM